MSGTKQLVLVGDGAVGKTCIAHSYTNEQFLEEYVPTIYEHESFDVTLNGKTHHIKLNDTAGQEEYDKLRKIIYKNANCFILCYSVDSRTSFANISSKWIPEIRTPELDVPIVLIATKIDLRSGGRPCISTREGEQLQKKINANAFIECSAKSNINIKEVIYEAIRASIAGVPEVEEESSGFGWICCNMCN